MNSKTSIRLLLATLAILTLTLAGCANLFGDDDDGDSAIAEVGDVLSGGWTVTTVDSSGKGYLAEREAEYGGDTEKQVLVAGTHFEDRTFTKDKVWYLQGPVFIGNNAQDPGAATGNTLTIDAGTTIRGNATDGSEAGVLIITRGSDIEAKGTATEPITFTSTNKVGERGAGDWGGLIINGYARVQGGYAEGEGDTGQYGGGESPINDDNSGTIKYVRVQFGGTLFSPDNELNGIVLQAVGSGTTIEFVQVHKNADDGIEWFGGSAQVKYYVGTGNEDDTADSDDGWDGSLQFAILQHYPLDTGSLIEADGDAEDVFPAANGIYANITAIGSEATSTGLRFKSNADNDVYNSVFDVQENNETPAYVDAGDATINYFGTLVVGGTPSDESGNADLEEAKNGNELRATASGIEGAVAVLTGDVWSANFDVQPTAGTFAAQDLPATDPAGNALTATDYIGAYDGTNKWWEGWIDTPAN